MTILVEFTASQPGYFVVINGLVRQVVTRLRCRPTSAGERTEGATLERFGRLDLLVNNAGVAPKKRVDLLEMGEESYDRVMDTNLKGPFFLAQQVAKVMIELVEKGEVKDPQIVNISSVSAFASGTNLGEYCLSKAGMGMMTALFADRLAQYGIAVFKIRPGVIATDMTAGVKEKYDRMFEAGLVPINRWGVPEEVARAVVAITELTSSRCS